MIIFDAVAAIFFGSITRIKWQPAVSFRGQFFFSQLLRSGHMMN